MGEPIAIVVQRIPKQDTLAFDLRLADGPHGSTWPPINTPHDVLGRAATLWFQSGGNNVPSLSDDTLRNPDVMKTFEFYVSNTDRALTALSFPTDMYEYARRVEVIAQEVPKLKAGWSSNAKTVESEIDSALKMTGQALLQGSDSSAELFYRMLPRNIHHEALVGYGNRDYAHASDQVALLGGTSEWARFHSTLRAGLENQLRSSLLNLWTAFESCATDLWILAVNRCPKTLGANVVLLPTSGVGRASNNLNDTKSNSPRIAFSDLLKYGFDVSKRLGDFLVKDKRVSLDSLLGLRAAYLDAFRQAENRKSPPHPAVEALFKGDAYGKLRRLEAMRNLLSHRGGVVDERFLDDLRKSDQNVDQYTLGRQIQIDMAVVNENVSITTTATVLLLNFVSEWLDKYSD